MRVSTFSFLSQTDVPFVTVVNEIGMCDAKAPEQEECEAAELHVDKTVERPFLV